MDETNTAPAQDIEASAIEIALVLLKVAADPRRTQANLDAIVAGKSQLKDERRGMDREMAARTRAIEPLETAAAEKMAEAEAAYRNAAERLAEADRKEAKLHRIAKDIETHDRHLRIEIMRFAQLLPHFNEKLQALPSWPQLAADVLAKTVDPMMEGGQDIPAAAEPLEHMPVENLIAGSALTRSGPKNMRRGAN